MGMAGHVTFLYTTARLMLLAVLTRISSMAILKISTRLEKDSATIDKINAHYFDKKAEDYFFNKFLLSILILNTAMELRWRISTGTERLVRRL